MSKKKDLSLEEMTTEELIEMRTRLSLEVDALKEQARAINAILDTRATDDLTDKLLEGLSEEQKEALRVKLGSQDG